MLKLMLTIKQYGAWGGVRGGFVIEALLKIFLWECYNSHT